MPPYSLNQIGNAVGAWWWVGIAIILLLIIANVDPKLGGWLLIVVVMGMIYAAHARPTPLI